MSSFIGMLRTETCPPGRIPPWTAVWPELFTLTVATSNSGGRDADWANPAHDMQTARAIRQRQRVKWQFSGARLLLRVFGVRAFEPRRFDVVPHGRVALVAGVLVHLVFVIEVHRIGNGVR